MKIKSGKIGNINKKLLAGTLALVSSMTMLAGCTGDELSEIVLSDTVLAGKRVITFEDGSKDVVKKDRLCMCDDPHYIYYSCTKTPATYYVDDYCKSSKKIELAIYTEIKETKDILNYLTSQEIKKATNNKLTDEDILNIKNRIIGKDKEQKAVQKIK